MKHLLPFRCAFLVGILSWGWFSHACAQVYEDYFGHGHQIGMKVSSSNPQSSDTASHAVSGTALRPGLAGSSRFLSQATLGYDWADMQHVEQIGIEAWLEEQFALPQASYEQAYWDDLGYQDYLDFENDPNNPSSQAFRHLSSIFYSLVLREEDKLRHKLAFALSQILVVSTSGQAFLSNNAHMLAHYYDLLYLNAFGNYRDILTEVTLSPAMGRYLSSYRNQKADYGLNIRPDENYAREVMQLFTIGLVELQNDGTPKLDADGNLIPTYNNEDIQEMAKVFTGLSEPKDVNGANLGFFSNTDRHLLDPLDVFGAYHDVGPKEMIDGTTLPGGRTGTEDIEDALDLLFAHPNTGPFISIRLIQSFVKSNPSPAYVNRVALVFADNGKGVRGDLQAVIKAILTDPEARACEWMQHPNAGKLIQPMERTTRFLAAFEAFGDTGDVRLRDNYTDHLGQRYMGSPTVFNYFSPFYGEEKHVEPNGMVSPEFQILNSVTAIENLNLYEVRIESRPFRNFASGSGVDHPDIDLSYEVGLMTNQGVSAVLDHFDLLLCRGQLSAGTRKIIEDAITEAQAASNNYSDLRAVQETLYYLLASPDYLILK